MSNHCAIVTCFFLGICGAAAAAPEAKGPDFSRSSIEVSTESPIEYDVVRYSVNLRNSGDVSADFAQLEVEWPLMGFFLGVEGLPEAEIDSAAREIRATLALPAGGEKVVHVDVLAPRDSGGDALSLSAHLAYPYTGADWRDHRWLNIDTRLGKPGAMGLTAAGWLFILWLVSAGAIWFGVRLLRSGGARTGHRGTAFAIIIPLGFWMIFLGMAWRDYQVLHVWPEAMATIVGRRDRIEKVTERHRSASGATVTGETTLIQPEFALRYEVNGMTYHSTGYDTGSSIRIGGRVRREAEMRDWVKGARIPCYYNPRNPHDVVVRRGYGGAYFFALVPLPVFLLGLASLRRRVR